MHGPDGVPALPAIIQTQPLLGGGLSLAGRAGDPDKALPFSLRSRVVYRQATIDEDGESVAAGMLVFKGYYDGTSKEYIKGDPLLLLNVMADSDRERLKQLCMNGNQVDSAAGCDEYLAAVDELYWKTYNPAAGSTCAATATASCSPAISTRRKTSSGPAPAVSRAAPWAAIRIGETGWQTRPS